MSIVQGPLLATPKPGERVAGAQNDDIVLRFHGCFSSQSFWKAGSARKGSQ